MRIKDISKRDQPRERLQRLGVSALSDGELLAVILLKGTRQENAVDMSNRLISRGGIDGLSDLSLTELQEIRGVGPVKAMQIKALFEFNKRHNLTKRYRRPIKSAKDVFEYASQILSRNDKEHIMVLHLDSKSRITKNEIVSIGTLNGSLIHPREVFKSAIKESANAIILVHNHPSGDPTPSKEDKQITKKLSKAGELLGIKLLDHVILGDKKWWSWREN